MAKEKGLQPLRMKPLTGSFDSRSLPELVAPETWRMLQNTRTTARGRICRLPGWEKFLSGLVTSRPYNNEDLHDQLLSLQIYYDSLTDVDSTGVTVFPPNNPDFGDFCGTTKRTRTQGRQPITFAAEITSSLGTRHCLAGFQSRLCVLNVGKGNWSILADGLGGTSSNPEIRFQHAGIGDYVFLTNNFDEPFYWQINQGPTGCSMQSVQNIPELQEIGVTKVRCLASYKGTLFFANVEQDGQRRTNRIIWSRYQSPLEVVEDPGVSTAGTQDLDFGEDIIAMRELGDFLYIYTDRAIWLCVVSADGLATFAFVRKYRAQKGDGTLVYPYTLTGSKDSHYYMSKDGIYEWNPYVQAPIRQEWIHQSSNILYDNLNESKCAAHVAGYSSKTKELMFFAAQGSDALPSVGLSCNTDYGQCSKIDHGFTCVFEYTPDTRESVRDWLLNNCVVNEACLDSPEIQALGFATPKEGAGVPAIKEPCTSLVQHVYSSEELELDDDVVVEDYTQDDPSPGSLCSQLGDVSIAEGCNNCEGATLFVGACATDWCLKTIGAIYARERRTDTGYALDGYDTILLKGPMLFGSANMKMLSSDSSGGAVLLEFEAEPQTVPSNMKLRVGASRRAEDPLKVCGIQWYTEEERPIACVDDDRAMEWAAYAVDVALYLEFKISGTGGASCYSSLQVNVGPGGC